MRLIEILKRLPHLEGGLDSHGLKTKLRVLQHIYFGDYEYSVSVQASFYHYCIPRETLDLSEYTHFAVMLNIPDEDVPVEWEKFNYCGDKVYGYVPIESIEQLIDDLGKKYKMVRVN